MCKISRSAYLPFDDSAEVSAFNSRVKTEYNIVLAAMSDFVAGFIDSGTSAKKDECIVKALLELIDGDETIDDTQLFYVNENGSFDDEDEVLDGTYYENVTIMSKVPKSSPNSSKSRSRMLIAENKLMNLEATEKSLNTRVLLRLARITGSPSKQYAKIQSNTLNCGQYYGMMTSGISGCTLP